MQDKTTETNDSMLRYMSPKVNVIPMTMQSVLCQSVNGSMNEVYYGDGGFREE